MTTLGAFKDNREKSRFELPFGSALAFAEYIRNGQQLIVFRTEIPDSFSQVENSAEQLIEHILQQCAGQNLELVVRCPFAKALVHRYQQKQAKL